MSCATFAPKINEIRCQVRSAWSSEDFLTYDTVVTQLGRPHQNRHCYCTTAIDLLHISFAALEQGGHCATFAPRSNEIGYQNSAARSAQDKTTYDTAVLGLVYTTSSAMPLAVQVVVCCTVLARHNCTSRFKRTFCTKSNEIRCRGVPARLLKYNSLCMTR